MAPTTRSSKNVFVTTCFILAALIAFQITREDPEIAATFNHADVAAVHDGVHRNVSALDASTKREAHHGVDAPQLQAESGAALPVEITKEFDHEATSKTTAQNASYSFKLPAKRTSTLDPTKTFSFVHISKVGPLLFSSNSMRFACVLLVVQELIESFMFVCLLLCADTTRSIALTMIFILCYHFQRQQGQHGYGHLSIYN
jgi:hypothetical protein